MKKEKKIKMKCRATIEFGDDFGDNSTTFHCRLEKGHNSNHKETGNLYGTSYSISWSKTKKGIIKSLKLKEVRTYCEAECDCPTCHIGIGNKGVTDVKKCYYCQKKWKNKGQYAPHYWDKK